MIYWFVGQPGTGKSTLARRLKKHFDAKVKPSIHLDGDDLRKIFKVPYVKENLTADYRTEQTRCLQRFVAHCADQGTNVIVSTVNAYRDVREEFKASRDDVKEIYVFSEPRVRHEFWVKDFEPPMYVDDKTKWINTTDRTEDESFAYLFDALKKKVFVVTYNGVRMIFNTLKERREWEKRVFSNVGGLITTSNEEIIL